MELDAKKSVESEKSDKSVIQTLPIQKNIPSCPSITPNYRYVHPVNPLILQILIQTKKKRNHGDPRGERGTGTTKTQRARRTSVIRETLGIH